MTDRIPCSSSRVCSTTPNSGARSGRHGRYRRLHRGRPDPRRDPAGRCRGGTGAGAGRFALAGFSLGGFVAQQILRTAPERVLQLALIDTSIHADSSERAEQRRSQRASVRLPGKFHGFGDALMRSYIDASRLDDYVLVQRVRDMTARLGAEVFLRQSALERSDGHDVLAGYRDPLLIVCGANDRITPLAVSEEMHALVPHSQLVVVPDCGHRTDGEAGRGECGNARMVVAGVTLSCLMDSSFHPMPL